MKLLNAFSTSMLTSRQSAVTFTEIAEGEASRRLIHRTESAVGHPATAAVLTARLGFPIPAARVTVTLEGGEEAVIAQLVMPRLNEGEVLSPEQVAALEIRYLLVRVANHLPLAERRVIGEWRMGATHAGFKVVAEAGALGDENWENAFRHVIVATRGSLIILAPGVPGAADTWDRVEVMTPEFLRAENDLARVVAGDHSGAGGAYVVAARPGGVVYSRTGRRAPLWRRLREDGAWEEASSREEAELLGWLPSSGEPEIVV